MKTLENFYCIVRDRGKIQVLLRQLLFSLLQSFFNRLKYFSVSFTDISMYWLVRQAHDTPFFHGSPGWDELTSQPWLPCSLYRPSPRPPQRWQPSWWSARFISLAMQRCRGGFWGGTAYTKTMKQSNSATICLVASRFTMRPIVFRIRMKGFWPWLRWARLSPKKIRSCLPQTSPEHPHSSARIWFPQVTSGQLYSVPRCTTSQLSRGLVPHHSNKHIFGHQHARAGHIPKNSDCHLVLPELS